MTQGRVYLVGAGPGHPGLLTLRAVECMRRADLILYDKLVPTLLLEHAAPTARRVCVADLGVCHPDRHPPAHEEMIAAARRGQIVVRLKGGDPCLFGRGGEDAQALVAAGVAFEIVPGVTAALGMAAFAGMPLTHRHHASAVAFITGHENPAKPESMLDWSALARFPGTLVVYMGMSRIERIVRQLLDHGKDPATPAAVVQCATQGGQRTLTAALADLPGAARAAGLAAPALILIGDVVRQRQDLAWFEQLPLFGQRVLVTRPRGQAMDFVSRLIDLGAVPTLLPTVEIHPLTDWRLVDDALSRLKEFAWLVFTSVNGVSAFLNRLLQVGLDLRALAGIKLAAIGPKTAEALRGYHLIPDLVPHRYQSEDLAAALLDHMQPGQRVLLARADRGREVLRAELSQKVLVEQVAVYHQVDAALPEGPELDSLRRGEIDVITLTSANVARVLLDNVDATTRDRLMQGHIALATISPVTSAEVRRLGYPIAVEAPEATMAGMIQALIALKKSE